MYKKLSRYKSYSYGLLYFICSCFTTAQKCSLKRPIKSNVTAGVPAKKRRLERKNLIIALDNMQVYALAQAEKHPELLQKFDFELAIQELRAAADRKRGIQWHLSSDTLVREVVETSNKHLYAAEDYIVQIINIYRAAAKTCQLYGKDDSPFRGMAVCIKQEYKKDMYAKTKENDWIDQVKEVNYQVILMLKEMVFPDKSLHAINADLRLAENYVGLDDKHYNVTTKFKVGGKQFALENKKWLNLTSTQQRAFKYRQSEGWYQRLRPFEKKFLDAYLPKFLDGAHYIPTQIRLIPGCRNAYQKSVLTYDQNGNAVVLGRYYHSGTLASFVPDPILSTQIVRDNWEQVSMHDKNVEVMCLNNNVDLKVGNYDLSEKFIVEQTRQIVGKKRFMYIPINLAGKFTTPIFKDQFKQLWKDTKTIKPTDPKNKRLVQEVQELKKAAENSDNKNKLHHVGKISRNYYAELGAKYIACQAVLNQRNKQTHPTVLFNCKSGKDRTGYISYLVDGTIIQLAHPTLCTAEEIYSALASAAHPQFLSSINGGMPGRFGMKPVTRNLSMTVCSPTAIRPTTIDRKLFTKPASLTKIHLP